MLLFVTKGTLCVIKDLDMGDCPGVSRWAHCHHGLLCVGGGGRRDGKMLCWFQRWNKATSQGVQWPLEAGKGTEMDSPLELPEGMQPAGTWALGLVASRTVR